MIGVNSRLWVSISCGSTPDDHGLGYMIKGLAQGQRFKKINLMQRILGPDPLRDGVAFQAVYIAGIPLVSDAIRHNQMLGFGYHPQQVDSQNTAIDQQHIFREFVLPFPFFLPHALRIPHRCKEYSRFPEP